MLSFALNRARQKPSPGIASLPLAANVKAAIGWGRGILQTRWIVVAALVVVIAGGIVAYNSVAAILAAPCTSLGCVQGNSDP